MAIDFSRVNISLDQFQKMASGDYNAGEVALKSETKLTKINNHVHAISWNTKSISHEEIMAIKNAFVNALESNGVTDKAKINEIRKELGLAPDETAPKSLAERSIKPLTRQQIREIIDRNINDINASRAEKGEKAFKDSTALYGTDKKYLDNMQTKRDAALSGLDRTLTPSQEITNFQSVLSGDFGAIPKNEGKATGNLAIQQRDEILAQCKNAPGTDGNTVLTFTTSTGQKIQFSSGKSPLDTVKMLDEAYLRLAHGSGTEKRNSGIIEAFTRSAEKIPFEFRKMAIEVREEATAIFGKESVRQDDKDIGSLARFRDFIDFDNKMTKAGQDITPENMREHFRTACLRKSAENFLGEAIKNAMDGAGIAVENENDVGNAVKKLNPGLVDRLAAATNADEAKQIVDGLKANIVSVATKCSFCDQANAKLNDFIQEAFAKEMGVEWKSGDKVLVNTSRRADSKGNDLATDILWGKVAVNDKAAIEAEFEALAAKIAHGHAEKLRQVSDLKLPADSEFLVSQFLVNHNDPRKLNVGRALELSKDVDVKGLADAFRTNASKEKIYQELEKTSKSADGKVFKLFEGEKEIGGEESMLGAPVMLFMALGKDPELATQLAKFFARPDVQADRQEVGEKMPQAIATLHDYVNNGRLMPADIAATLGKTSMSPLFSPALFKAVDEIGLGKLSASEKHALFANGTAEGKALRQSLQALGDKAAITPDILYGLAKEAVRNLDAGKTLKLFEAAKPFRQNADKVLAAGYHKSELPMLANAFELIRLATGCSEAEALVKTLDPQSRERRLFGYGGRFVASPENFSKGLALMEKFGGWYQGVTFAVQKYKDNRHNVPNPTVRNADSNYLASNTLKAYEKFLFEEIAANDSLPLGADNLDEVFGMEANPAMRFVGRGYTTAINDTVARMPVEARQILFAAFDAMLPLATDAAGLRENNFTNGVTMPIARVMRHLDDLREMQKTGNLTAQNVKTLLFPEVQDAGTKSLKAITDEIDGLASKNFITDMPSLLRVVTMMQSSGCTYDEAVAANKEGRILPPAPHILSGTGQLSDLDGTARGARTQAVGDLIRPSIPEPVKGGEQLVTPQNRVFTVNFPDGTVLTAGAAAKDSENKVLANAIADKVEALVGVKHQAQLASVMIGLSQSAHGPFLDNSKTLGFVNKAGAEHAAITYTFAKNEETGEITIRYSEPQGCPKKFHWETTIALDGSAVTTPLVVDD